MCSSRWVTLILVRQTQSLHREGRIHRNFSNNVQYNERWSEMEKHFSLKFFFSELMGFLLSTSCTVSAFNRIMISMVYISYLAVT